MRVLPTYTALSHPRFTASHYTLMWAALAVGFGILIIWQPLAAAGLAVISVLVIAYSLTPLAALITLLVFAPLRTLVETEARGLLPLEIGLLMVMLFGFFWFVARVTQGHYILRFPYSRLWVFLFPFVMVAGVSLFNAISVSAWLSEWLKWIILLVMAFMAYTLKRWEWLIFGVVLAALANAVIGLYTFLGGSGALHLLINDRFFRAFGTFGQPNPFGGFMGLIAPLAAGAAWGYLILAWQQWRDTRSLHRGYLFCTMFYTGATAFIALGVIISWSRGAWLGFAVAMLIVVVLLPRRRWFSAVVLAVLIIGGGFVWSSGRLPTAITERISSATQELFNIQDVRGVDITPDNYAVVERLAHWQAALNMASAHPFLGIGFGNYEAAYDQYRILNWREPLGHAHNYYLNVLAETGIIGLTCYIVLWFGVIWSTWRVLKHPDALARSVAVGLLGTWAYLLLHSLTDNLYVNNLFLHLGILLGVVMLLHNQLWVNVRIERP